MRALLILLVAAVTAGLAHVATLLLVPRLLPASAFDRLADEAPVNAVQPVPDALAAALPFADPAILLARCRYDLGDGPLRLRSRLSASYLAVVFAAERKGIFASVSDRAATSGVLDVVLATRAQLDRIEALDTEGEAVDEIRLVAPAPRGLALFKLVVERPSAREEARELLAQASCETEALPGG